MSFIKIMQITTAKLLKDLGTKCTIVSMAGPKKSGYGVIVNSDAKTDLSGSNGFITPADKLCYVQGKLGLIPAVGDTIKFKINTYTIIEVYDITPDDNTKNTIVYRLGIRP